MALKRVKSHIESFVRKSTEKEHLDPNLSILKMYSLYKEHADQKGFSPVSRVTYRRYFCKNYNYSCFMSKKDQCGFCAIFKLLDAEKKHTLKEDYEKHLLRKHNYLKLCSTQTIPEKIQSQYQSQPSLSKMETDNNNSLESD